MDDVLSRVSADTGLAWSKVNAIIDGFFRQLPNMVIALCVFVLILVIGRILRWIIQALAGRRGRQDVGQVFGSLAYWLVVILAILIVMTIVFPSVKPVDLLSTLGIGSIAIGFAFKDILQNLLAGMLILLRRPFRIGDQIVVGGYEGTVEHVNARATILRTYDSRRIVMPNSDVYTGAVTVNTAFEHRRTQAEVGIGYGDDIEEAREVILDTLRGVPGVLAEPAPDVLVTGYAASTVTLKVRWWTEPDRASVLRAQDAVLSRLKPALGAAGIDLPFDTRMVLFHDQTEDVDGDRRRQREGWPTGKGGAPRPRWQARDGAEPKEGVRQSSGVRTAGQP